MHSKKRFSLSTTQIILISFLLVILLGSALLSLPISSASGERIPYIDALFTATTSVCVTGLVTVTTATAWSTFGHVIILFLIQIGGLGVITVLSGVMLLIHRRMSVGERLLLQDAFNLNSMANLASFIRKVLGGTLAVELVGALLYMTVFIPEFGAKGVWISFFTAVSAFCNAGIDIIGESSLYAYATHPLVNAVTCTLIVLGGIGYIVWWDVFRVSKLARTGNRRFLSHLTLHSKIAVSVTLLLILGGGALFLAFEWSNPRTIGTLSVFDKIQVALFQSVTCRTAGFATVPQEELTSGSVAASLLLMLIGGSPVGTAGGVKTVTIAVLVCVASATIRGKKEKSLFGRRLPEEAVNKAVAVVVLFVAILLVSTFLLALTTEAPLEDVLFETVSATATVGLSRALTSSLNNFGKLIVIATMYLGRVGPISLAIAFGASREKQNSVKEPTEEISVG